MTTVIPQTDVESSETPNAHEIEKPKRFSYRAYLDGVRGLSVAFVVLFHTGITIFREGFLGVDVFFVLSGYLITSIILCEVDANGVIDIFRFYGRRARRILPGAAVTIVLVCTYYRIVDPPSLGEKKTCFMAAATYWANHCFISKSTDYWASSAEESPVKHYWSLSIEEQFYCVYPFFLLLLIVLSSLVFWMFKKLEISNITTKKRLVNYVMLIFISVLVCLSFSYAIYISFQFSMTVSHMSSFGRVYQLGSGGILSIVLHLLKESKRTVSPRSIFYARYASLFLICCVLFLMMYPIFFPTINVHPTYSGSVMMLVVVFLILCMEIDSLGALQSKSLSRKILSLPFFVYLGKWSYSIYLWHFPLIVFGDKFYLLYSRYDIIYKQILRVLSICSLSVLFGLISYFVVERTFMRIKIDKLSQKLKLASLGIIIPVLTCIFIMYIVVGVDHLPNSRSEDPDGFGEDFIIPKLNISSISNFTDTQGNNDSDLSISQDQADYFKGTRIMVVGDSHAGMMGKMWEYLAGQININITLVWFGGFNFVFTGKWAIRRSTFLEELAEVDPDLIFLNSISFVRFLGGCSDTGPTKCKVPLDTFEGKMRKQFNDFLELILEGKKDRRIVHLLPEPLVMNGYGFPNVKECVKVRKNEEKCEMPMWFKYGEHHNRAVSFFTGLQEEMTNFKVIDWAEWFCPNKVCKPTYKSQVYTLWDNNHYCVEYFKKRSLDFLKLLEENKVFMDGSEDESNGNFKLITNDQKWNDDRQNRFCSI